MEVRTHSARLVGCGFNANALNMRRYPVGALTVSDPNQSRHASNVAGSPISGAEFRALGYPSNAPLIEMSMNWIYTVMAILLTFHDAIASIAVWMMP